MSTNRKWAIGTAVLAAAVLVLGVWLYAGTAWGGRGEGVSAAEPEPLPVTVVHPAPGGLDRTTTQPGTVKAFEYEEIYANVAGYLLHQKVDIGTRVKAGEVLAEIAAPELLKDEERAAAELEQAKAVVLQMESRVAAARAELEVARLAVAQKKAEVKRAESTLTYRKSAYNRIKELAEEKSVDRRLLDEQFEQLQAAQASKEAAEAGQATAVGDVAAKQAKVAQAEADLAAARASVAVAEAVLARARVVVGYTRIRSDYDGVVTRRNYHNGDYVRAGSSGNTLPLLVVQRTDKMRVVVQIPDVDVPFCSVGDPADVSISALPHVKFPTYHVSRLSGSENERSRTMRVEVDVPNANGLLRDGMYGSVTIHLEKGPGNAFRVPSSAVRPADGLTNVFVVRGGKAHAVAVHVGLDNGAEAEILSGLRADDLVIAHPGGLVQDGLEVRPVLETRVAAH